MARKETQIALLAADIQYHTAIIDAHIANNHLKEPSFDEGGSQADVTFPPPVQQSRQRVLEATQELNELLLGPSELIRNHLVRCEYMVYDVIHRYKLAELIPQNGSLTYPELAKATGLAEVAIKKIVKYGIVSRIFEEKEPGHVSHSAVSRVLAEDPATKDWLGTYIEDLDVALHQQVEALSKWPEAEEPNRTGYAIAMGEEVSFFDGIGRDAEKTRRFAGTMKRQLELPEMSPSHLTDNYSWAKLNGGTVVDVGGSTGSVAFALAAKYPDLNIVVQDQADVVQQAVSKPGVKVSFMAHDFFQPQPIQGAALYYYRWCFHDWSDKYCIKMLRALVPALHLGCKVLIMDTIMPAVKTMPLNIERFLRSYELSMLTIGNGYEREAGEWEDLFAAADARFRIDGIRPIVGSQQGLIEVTWMG